MIKQTHTKAEGGKIKISMIFLITFKNQISFSSYKKLCFLIITHLVITTIHLRKFLGFLGCMNNYEQWGQCPGFHFKQ